MAKRRWTELRQCITDAEALLGEAKRIANKEPTAEKMNSIIAKLSGALTWVNQAREKAYGIDLREVHYGS